MSGVKKQSQAGVGLLSKAFQILDLFQLDRETWTQAEIIRATNLNRSAVNRLVRYLAEQGYLRRIGETGGYTLGFSAVSLGRRANAGLELKELCQPVLGKLSDKTEETVILTQLNRTNWTAVCIDQIEGRRDGLRVFETIGATFPLHAGAAPRAIMALLAEPDVEHILDRPVETLTDNTIVERARLRDELRMTGERGYSISREETYPGVFGVAVGFRGPDVGPAGSIAIAAPMQVINDAKISAYGAMLNDAAREITGILSGRAET